MTSPAAPELQFVLAALRRDAAAPDARAAAAALVQHWDTVASLARRHDVPFWVHRALPTDGVPDPVRAALAADVRALAVRALAGVGELLTLTRALDAAGVGVVAYKGPALSNDVHGDVGARRFTDLDLLIAERDLARAASALRALGYESPERFTAREAVFYSRWEGVRHFERDGAGWPVEVHFRVQAPRYGAPQDPVALVASARRCALGGGTVALPEIEAQGVLLALHGVKHAWTSLLWVVDFAASVSGDGFSWERFDALATGWGVRRATHIALLLAQRLLALHVPTAQLAAAQRDHDAIRLASEAADGLLSDTDAPNTGRESTARYDLRWLEGAAAKMRYLALAAALPTPQERKLAHLPDTMLPLAYPVRAWRLLRHAMGRRA